MSVTHVTAIVAVLVAFAAQTPMSVPVYEVDPAWPKPLPNHWLVGAVVGVAVDRQDHIWMTHRPSTLQPNETRSFWRAAPPVLEFDQQGTVVSSWGGPGAGYEWPQLEHGIFVDDQDHVWLGGGGEKDAQILKFTRQGRFVMQIGRQGQGRGSNDTQNLGAAAHMVVDRAANELYVADGYINHRVIVFDAATGAYKESQYRTVYFHESGPEVDRKYEHYISGFGKAAGAFGERHRVFPILVAMERLDARACRDLARRLPGAPVFTSGDYDMFQLVSILRCCSLMVSSRYHGIVTSMPALVASAGVTMDERIRNLMNERGHQHLLLTVDEPDLEGADYGSK